MNKRLASSLIFLTFLWSFLVWFPLPVQAATTATFYLSPMSRTVTQDTNFSVEVLVDTGVDNVNAVQANLSYDATKLEFVSISTTNSAFGIEAENTGGAGMISLGRGTHTAKAGPLLIATVTFKAKVGSGSTMVSFASGTEAVLVDNTVTNTTNKVEATYSLTTPPTQAKVGDLNGDGLVNIADFGIFLGKWGTADQKADLSHDGIVNISDFGIFLGKWGT